MASLPLQRPPCHGSSEVNNLEDAEDAEGHMEDTDEPPTGEEDDDGWQRVHRQKKRPTRTDRATISEHVAEALPPANVDTAVVASLAIPQAATAVAALPKATFAGAPAVMKMTYAECLTQPVHPPFVSFRPAIPAAATPTLQPPSQF
ncbi:hypothetical protein HPB48_010917 [Haemaphysalis longicornis]|uniref:Uncharacterized protein n=1 Tax=Haemaphysalis longicornis TaxID=44386 RepID=A0A9J6GUD3_HAELO|nr:hypothetical protein HPB48_010917 [Haemaphysalis longicornis]